MCETSAVTTVVTCAVHTAIRLPIHARVRLLVGGNTRRRHLGEYTDAKTKTQTEKQLMNTLIQTSIGRSQKDLFAKPGRPSTFPLIFIALTFACFALPLTMEADENNICYVGSIWGQTSSGGAAVFINSAGKLGTTTSSRRFKEDIKPMNDASEGLFALQPVTFRYKKEIDSQGIPQFGLIAEDVEKVNPDLVVRDKEGKVNTVRYEQINAMLLNEFLKEHKAFVEEQGKVKNLEAGLASLLATVKEQAAQIEKVSSELQSRRPIQSLARNLP